MLRDNLNGFYIEGVSFLQEQCSWKLVLLMVSVFIFWMLFIALVMKFIPQKYHLYKKEIFIFLVVLNVGLLFMGFILTLAFLLFGLYWATFRMSRPVYGGMDASQYFIKTPRVESKFHEGVLTMMSTKEKEVNNDEMIKSLETICNSNEYNNIGKIKHLLSSNRDEVRLLTFSHISSYEKELTTKVKIFEEKIKHAKTKQELELANYLLAETYWQFIFHGVADANLIEFYIEKIERYLKRSGETVPVAILNGKINMHRKNYNVAKKYFLEALALGAFKQQVFSYLAEVEYELKNFNNVSQYILNDMFDMDVKMKPYSMMWSS